jgi:hypothetical protein
MDIYSQFKFLRIAKMNDLSFFKTFVAKPLGIGGKRGWAGNDAEGAMKLLQVRLYNLRSCFIIISLLTFVGQCVAHHPSEDKGSGV